jgi:hypothetical protein
VRWRTFGGAAALLLLPLLLVLAIDRPVRKFKASASQPTKSPTLKPIARRQQCLVFLPFAFI